MANIRVDFNQTVGDIKPLHAVNDVPSVDFRYGGAKEGMDFFKESGIPYSRLHDVSGRYGGNVFVDVSNIFRNFDADENDPNNYDFTFTDKLLELMMESGIKPYYRLGETIENDLQIKRYRTNPPKDNLKWAKICEHIVMHYNYGWADGYEYNIEYWEIWNEPDNAKDEINNQMWGGTPEQFYELYSVAANHLKTKFPQLKIGGYGSVGFYSIAQKVLEPWANAEAGGSWYFIEYFEGFMKYIKSKNYPVPLDFFTWHSYSNVEQNIIYANYVRETLDKNGFTQTESHCNEWNPGPNKRNTMRDAINIISNMLMWQNAPIDMAVYYNSRITSSYGGMFNPLTWGVTKAFYSFKAFNALYRLGKQTIAESDDEQVLTVSATNGEDVAIVISNYSEEDKALKITGLEDITDKCVYSIDENNNLDQIDKDVLNGEIIKNEQIILIVGKKSN
ncbi:MAG: hypothetical protein IKB67_02675 [Clostridia bacterium]|nr:hypothetical protein [Clostridia bacterium]